MAAGTVFPVLRSLEYFTRPSIDELVEREVSDPGYCSRVPDFIIGRAGYGQVRFLSNTDVRGIDLNDVVRFDKHSVVVYEDETEPSILVEVLRCLARKQGARFLSFNPVNGQWKFEVDHFSRFGFVEEEEEDVVMDEAAVRQPTAEVRERDPPSNGYEIELSHSLPAHLGLDPAKMQEMRMAMFYNEEDDEFMEDGFPSDERYVSRERMNVDSPTSSGKGSRLRVLFSERANGNQLEPIGDDDQEGMVLDKKEDSPIDWKRYLGLIMWYQLPPDTSLDIIIRSYQHLLDEGKVPYPVPVYIDEGPLDEALQWSPAHHQEIWEITSALENHKSEIADWDLGAGIYIDFYILKNSMQEESAMDDSDPLEKNNESCKSFFGRLNDSLLVWGSKLPVESSVEYGRACYSKMAAELCELLTNTPSQALNVHMGCFQTMLNAPVPDDHKSPYLQEAVSFFTEILCSDSR
ncbi:hypothetical protein HU200_003713 [Digitaria exilis]|uniref:Peptidase S59 domain-containing protein n=1 Tax=Digitaria exilis TaxID=1010633 RepID=A0A835FXC5_9POAL|nr:hypothetical protein HU200_003713 [Digitaria exilis]